MVRQSRGVWYKKGPQGWRRRSVLLFITFPPCNSCCSQHSLHSSSCLSQGKSSVFLLSSWVKGLTWSRLNPRARSCDKPNCQHSAQVFHQECPSKHRGGRCSSCWRRKSFWFKIFTKLLLPQEEIIIKVHFSVKKIPKITWSPKGNKSKHKAAWDCWRGQELLQHCRHHCFNALRWHHFCPHLSFPIPRVKWKNKFSEGQASTSAL